MCNLRGVVRHSPWLAKLTHNTTTHKTTEVLSLCVRLSAKKWIIFSAVRAFRHPRVVSVATGRASVFPATLDKQQFLFCLDDFLVCLGFAWFLTPGQHRREESPRFQICRPTIFVQDCCRLLSNWKKIAKTYVAVSTIWYSMVTPQPGVINKCVQTSPSRAW